MRRFFVRPEQITDTSISLSGAGAHHLRSVLRLRSGQVVEFFDGTGTVYQTKILTLRSNLIEGEIIGQYVPEIDDLFPLTLAQVVLKGKKMDVVVQKATELGVKTLIPIISRYCEGGKNSAGRLGRWRRIVIEACKQSGRTVPMHIEPVMPLDALSVEDYHRAVCCWEKEKQALLLPEHLGIAGDILLLIGPEGGFHDLEIEWVKDNNFHVITLGPHVLRAETAALSVISIIKYLGLLAQAGCE